MKKQKFKNLTAFATHDFFWRCFKVGFYTFLLELYYLLYFSKENLYAPFVNGGLDFYKACLWIEFGLSLLFLFLLIGGIFKYNSLDQKHHKVWFWIFIVGIGLWFTTVWYKFAIIGILGSDNGLLYRSPLQNLVTYWLFGIKCHYEPGIYLVHQTFLIININCENVLDFSSILDSHGYIDTTKFYNFVCDGKSYLRQSNPKGLFPYIQAISKFNECFKIIIYFGNDLALDKSFFYYYKF